MTIWSHHMIDHICNNRSTHAPLFETSRLCLYVEKIFSQRSWGSTDHGKNRFPFFKCDFISWSLCLLYWSFIHCWTSLCSRFSAKFNRTAKKSERGLLSIVLIIKWFFPENSLYNRNAFSTRTVWVENYRYKFMKCH